MRQFELFDAIGVKNAVLHCDNFTRDDDEEPSLEFKREKNAEALELTGRAEVIALDKTGTITEGNPKVAEIIPAKGVTKSDLMTTAYALESKSEHPLALAVTKYAEKRYKLTEIEDFCALAGNGVSGIIDGVEVLGGSYKFISSKVDISAMADDYDRLTAEGKTPLFFVKGGQALGIIAVADAIRPDSREAIADMKAMGLRVMMLTGDNSRTASAIGREAGVDEVFSDLLPDGKEAIDSTVFGKRGQEYGADETAHGSDVVTEVTPDE